MGTLLFSIVECLLCWPRLESGDKTDLEADNRQDLSWPWHCLSCTMNAGLCSTTGHRVEAAASPHTTAASIISLLIIMTPCHTKYCIQVTCNCALRKFIYVFEPPNQNTHLFVCTIHILVMLAPDPTRATTPASAGPLLASGSNHSRYYLSGSCGPASAAGCPAVLQCPGHPHILYLLL